MEALREYLKTLSPDEQKAFAERCGTSVSYLRKMLSLSKKGKKIGMNLAVDIERETAGQVRREQLLPLVDWAKFQPAPKKFRRTNVAA